MGHPPYYETEGSIFDALVGNELNSRVFLVKRYILQGIAGRLVAGLAGETEAVAK